MAKPKTAITPQPAGSPANDIMEDPNAIIERYEQTEEFVKKNRLLIGGIAAAVILVVLGIVFLGYYNRQQNLQAQTDMFSAVYHFENDSLNLALNGDGNNVGFLYIADEFSRTDAGNQANFYIGAIYLKQGQFQQAIDYLRDFSSGDILLQARAYALTGDAYMELDNFADAEKFYSRAANHEPNRFFTPTYLMKLALAQERNNKLSAAVETYDKIMVEYPESAEVSDAKKYKSRAEAMQAN
jgi:TolA-binding protein